MAAPPPLPPAFEAWFQSRGWSVRPHQLALLEEARAGRSTLLVAPTGAGKTLAGFLPSLVELAGREGKANGGDQRQPLRLHARPRAKLTRDVRPPASDHCNLHARGQRAQPAVEVDLHARR